MNTNVLVPQGEQVVTVELTLKEAMALSGYRFNQNTRQLADARRKVRKALDTRCIGEVELPVIYEELTH
jgi:hypothetical protein